MKRIEIVSVRVVFNKVTIQFVFNVHLSLYFILDISIIMVKLVTFYCQLVLGKIQIDPIAVNVN